MRVVFYFLILLYANILFAQEHVILTELEKGDTNYKKGDFATSLLNYEKVFELSKKIEDNTILKDSLFYVSLKKIITVAGINKAKEVCNYYFQTNKEAIFRNICEGKYKVLQIGIINNYIGLAQYNKEPKLATTTYERFKKFTKDCTKFRQVDYVQSAANAALAYADLGKFEETVKILPLISYFKDSLPNWTTADYQKVVGFFKSKNTETKKEVIEYYTNAAEGYTTLGRYNYALDLYESLLQDYGKFMNTDQILKVVENSQKLKDSTVNYHNTIYKNMMVELGQLMITKTKTKNENNKLKNYLGYSFFSLAICVIIILLYLTRHNNNKKNYYKKLYLLEKKIEQQNEKLSSLKNNFLNTNYNISLNNTNNHKLFETLHDNFPELKFNISKYFSDLTQKELQIIYCTLLNLSSKHSADLLAMTSGSFRVAKNRLIKKLNLKDADEFKDTLKKLL